MSQQRPVRRPIPGPSQKLPEAIHPAEPDSISTPLAEFLSNHYDACLWKVYRRSTDVARTSCKSGGARAPAAGGRRWSVNHRALGIQKQERRHAHLDRDVLLLSRAADAEDGVAAGLQLPHEIDGLLKVPGGIVADFEEDVVFLESCFFRRTVLDRVHDLNLLGLVVRAQLDADESRRAFQFGARLVAHEEQRAKFLDALVVEAEGPLLHPFGHQADADFETVLFQLVNAFMNAFGFHKAEVEALGRSGGIEREPGEFVASIENLVAFDDPA